jgi:hypothetical protein
MTLLHSTHNSKYRNTLKIITFNPFTNAWLLRGGNRSNLRHTTASRMHITPYHQSSSRILDLNSKWFIMKAISLTNLAYTLNNYCFTYLNIPTLPLPINAFTQIYYTQILILLQDHNSMHVSLRKSLHKTTLHTTF